MSARRPSESGGRPRLLYLVTSFNGGGAEWGLVELLDGGAFDGFEVAVAALVRGQGAQLAALAERGIAPVLLSHAARPTPAALLIAAVRLARLLRARPWAALVLSLPHANVLGRLLRPARPRPLVLSFEHNSRLARPSYEVLYRLTASRVDWLLADCEATLDAAAQRRFAVPPPRQGVLPLVSFPPDRLDASPAPLRQANFHLVSAGRLSRTKDQGRLVALTAALRRRGLEARLTLYGEGPRREALLAEAAALGVADQVALPGRQTRWWETPADLFVLSSRHEGLCIAALEAMAAGLPVAAPPVGALADYGPPAQMLALGHGLEADADRLAALLQDLPRRRAMAEAGHAVVRARYGRESVRALHAAFAVRLVAACRAS